MGSGSALDHKILLRRIKKNWWHPTVPPATETARSCLPPTHTHTIGATGFRNSQGGPNLPAVTLGCWGSVRVAQKALQRGSARTALRNLPGEGLDNQLSAKLHPLPARI